MSAVAAQRRDRLDVGAVALMVALCAAWGLQQIAVKVAASHGLPPLTQAASRAAIASVLVVLWTIAREGRASAAVLWRRDSSLLPGLLLGLIFTGEFAILYPGLTLTSASRGVLFLYTAPFFTALGAHLLLPDDRLTTAKALGLAVAFSGVAAAFADGLARGQGSLRGDALCLGGAILWAASTLLIKCSPALGGTAPAKLLLYQIGLSAPALLALGLAAGECDNLQAPSLLAWLCLAYQAVVVAFASYLTWFWLVVRYPVGRLAPFTFLAPMFGIGFGGVLLDEKLGPALLVGLAAVAVGLRLLNGRG